jgi:hypothetical protein
VQARFGRPSLASLYLRAMDSIYKVQPDAIFVLEVSLVVQNMTRV